MGLLQSVLLTLTCSSALRSVLLVGRRRAARRTTGVYVRYRKCTWLGLGLGQGLGLGLGLG